MKTFGLSKSERLTSKKDFDSVFSSGKTIYSADNKIRAKYLVKNDTALAGVKFAAAVSRKAGKAVWRNRIKRLIKESYRHNKSVLWDVCTEKSCLLMLVISPNSLNQKNSYKIKLAEVMPPVSEVLMKINKEI